MRFRFLFALLIVLAVVPVSVMAQDATEEAMMMEDTPMPVMEIAVRQVKEDRLGDFVAARADFIALLKAQDGIVADREFESFFALPQPDETPVYIGMTVYESMDVVQAVGAALLETPEAAAFFDTFDFKAYVFVMPPEDFDLTTLAAEDGQVLELAVRAVNEDMDEKFVETRDAFVTLLSEQDGALESYELEVVSEDEAGRNITVGMTVYENQEKFQMILGGLQQEAVTGEYFATFVPVAAQYALSVSNDAETE